MIRAVPKNRQVREMVDVMRGLDTMFGARLSWNHGHVPRFEATVEGQTFARVDPTGTPGLDERKASLDGCMTSEEKKLQGKGKVCLDRTSDKAKP